MSIEEEIARAMRYAIRPDVPVHLPVPRMYEDMTAALSPLLNRVREEALREAARFLGTLHGEKVAANILEMYAREIEQNSEGNSNE